MTSLKEITLSLAKNQKLSLIARIVSFLNTSPLIIPLLAGMMLARTSSHTYP